MSSSRTWSLPFARRWALPPAPVHLRIPRLVFISACAFVQAQCACRYENTLLLCSRVNWCWRRRWDSNPCACFADNRISSAARCDHFDTSPLTGSATSPIAQRISNYTAHHLACQSFCGIYGAQLCGWGDKQKGHRCCPIAF